MAGGRALIVSNKGAMTMKTITIGTGIMVEDSHNYYCLQAIFVKSPIGPIFKGVRIPVTVK
jgi:hypothetical protein